MKILPSLHSKHLSSHHPLHPPKSNQSNRWKAVSKNLHWCFIKPYHVGVEKLKKTTHGLGSHSTKRVGQQGQKYSSTHPSLGMRIKHFMLGLALITPLVNSIVFIAYQRFKKASPKGSAPSQQKPATRPGTSTPSQSSLSSFAPPNPPPSAAKPPVQPNPAPIPKEKTATNNGEFTALARNCLGVIQQDSALLAQIKQTSPVGMAGQTTIEEKSLADLSLLMGKMAAGQQISADEFGKHLRGLKLDTQSKALAYIRQFYHEETTDYVPEIHTLAQINAALNTFSTFGMPNQADTRCWALSILQSLLHTPSLRAAILADNLERRPGENEPSYQLRVLIQDLAVRNQEPTRQQISTILRSAVRLNNPGLSVKEAMQAQQDPTGFMNWCLSTYAPTLDITWTVQAGSNPPKTKSLLGVPFTIEFSKPRRDGEDPNQFFIKAMETSIGGVSGGNMKFSNMKLSNVPTVFVMRQQLTPGTPYGKCSDYTGDFTIPGRFFSDGKDRVYRAKCLIYRSGDSGGAFGHYKTFVRENGQWRLFNDLQVSQKSNAEVADQPVSGVVFELVN